MVVLIGQENAIYQEVIAGPFLDHYFEEIVATFDTEEDAKDYIEKSRLKTPIKQTYFADTVFKKGSVLHSCVDAWIESDDKINVPHNPSLTK